MNSATDQTPPHQPTSSGAPVSPPLSPPTSRRSSADASLTSSPTQNQNQNPCIQPQNNSIRKSRTMPVDSGATTLHTLEDYQQSLFTNNYQRHHVRRQSVAIKFSPIYKTSNPFTRRPASPIAECIFKGEYPW